LVPFKSFQSNTKQMFFCSVYPSWVICPPEGKENNDGGEWGETLEWRGGLRLEKGWKQKSRGDEGCWSG